MANVIEYILKVQDQITPKLNKIYKSFSFGNSQIFFKSNPLAEALDFAIKEATIFEKQMVEVTKVLDDSFISNINNVRRLKRDLQDVVRVVPLPMENVMGIAAEGAKMGIDPQKIPGFTVAVAKVSRAFETSAEETSNLFIKILHALNREVTEGSIMYLGGELNEIANNMKARGSELLTALNLSTSALSAAGLTEKQIIAMNTAGIQVGLQPSVTGNALVKYAVALNKIQENKAGQRALSYLGIDKKTWDKLRENPIQRHEEIMKRFVGLREKAQIDKQAASDFQYALQTFFGFYRGKDIDRILAQPEAYEQALKLLSDEQEISISIEKEMAQVTETLNDKTLQLSQNMRVLGEEIGEIFIPSLKEISAFMNAGVEKTIDKIRKIKDDTREEKRSVLSNIISFARSSLIGAIVGGTAGIAAAAVSPLLVGPATLTAGGYAFYKAFMSDNDLSAVSDYMLDYVSEKSKPALDTQIYGTKMLQESLKRGAVTVGQSVWDTGRNPLNYLTFPFSPYSFYKSHSSEENNPLTIKISGDLKTPKGYDAKLDFENDSKNNKNFTLITE